MKRASKLTGVLLSIVMVTGFAGLAQAGPVTISEDDGTYKASSIVMTVTWETQVLGDDEITVEAPGSTSSPQTSGTGLEEALYPVVMGEDSEACGGYVALRCVSIHAETDEWGCEEADQKEDAQSCWADFEGWAEGEQWLAPAEISVEGFVGGTSVGEASCNTHNSAEDPFACRTDRLPVSVDGVVLEKEDQAEACSDVILFEGEGDDGTTSIEATLEGEACWTYHEEPLFQDPFDDPGDDPEDPGDGGDGGSGCRLCET